LKRLKIFVIDVIKHLEQAFAIIDEGTKKDIDMNKFIEAYNKISLLIKKKQILECRDNCRKQVIRDI